jgi:hypothetical protein
VKKSIKRMFWAALAAFGMAASAAGPAMAGTMINHSEPLVKP